MNKNPKKRISNEDVWTDKQISDLKKYYPVKENSFVAKKVNKTIDAIRAKAIKLRLKKENYFWQNKDEKFILKNVKVLSYPEIAEKLGRSKWAVINKYRELTGKRKGHKKLPF